MALACAHQPALAAAPVIVALDRPTELADAGKLPTGVRAMRAGARIVIGEASASGAPAPVEVPVASWSDFLVLGGGAVPRPLGTTATDHVANDGRIVLIRGDSAVVQLLDTRGRELSRFKLRAFTSRPAREEFDNAREVTLDFLPGTVRDAVEQSMAALPLPSAMPTHLAAAVDSKGRIWVQRAMFPRSRIEVYAADGHLLNTLLLPRAARLMDVNGGWLLLSARDADGVPDLRLHRVMETGR